MPRLLSVENQSAFASRLNEYANSVGLERCAVVFHGGEPLLMGVDALVALADRLRASTAASVEVGLQTNGLLLTEHVLTILERADISVSLSFDGPKFVNDKHRTTREGRSSYDKVLAALERLKRYPRIFAGVIAVIDPNTPPADLFAFFNNHQLPKLDFLLPDAHHLRPPPGRAGDPRLYERWLIDAFDIWLDQYPHLHVRTFESLLDSVLGLPSGTDAFGLGDVSLLTVETDGSYHDLDVLKVTHEGATKLMGTVVDTPIALIAASARIAAHRRLLHIDGLSAACRNCSIVEICGGGSLPHRYGQEGFGHPTIYCGEMLELVKHVQTRLRTLLASSQVRLPELPPDLNLYDFEEAERAVTVMDWLCADVRDRLASELRAVITELPSSDLKTEVLKAQFQALDADRVGELAIQPGAVAWQRAFQAQSAGIAVFAVDGSPLEAEIDYLAQLLDYSTEKMSYFAIGRIDPWLRKPFGRAIVFEDQCVSNRARPIVEEALAIIDAWRPALGNEIRQACRAIQFVRDPSAHPEKIVSFSDNCVPGALYVSVLQGDQFIDPYDLADSLVHEHRHQKLYLLERLVPLVEPTSVKVVSPWREDLRPPSGLLHAVFVFVELRRLWVFIRDHGPATLNSRAIDQVRETDKHLMEAFCTLKTCPLTSAGHDLVTVLKRACQSDLLHAYANDAAS